MNEGIKLYQTEDQNLVLVDHHLNVSQQYTAATKKLMQS